MSEVNNNESKNTEKKDGKRTLNILLTANSLKVGDKEEIDIKEFKTKKDE